jgi:DnaK suppressor protein
MPRPVDELTPEQIEELRSALQERQAELRHLLEVTREGVRPVDLQEPIGRLTRMDAIQQQKMTAANRRSNEVRLQQVTMALESIARGDYGACRKCEEPIGHRRLKARPESPYCLDCQDAIDRKRG